MEGQTNITDEIASFLENDEPPKKEAAKKAEPAPKAPKKRSKKEKKAEKPSPSATEAAPPESPAPEAPAAESTPPPPAPAYPEEDAAADFGPDETNDNDAVAGAEEGEAAAEPQEAPVHIETPAEARARRVSRFTAAGYQTTPIDPKVAKEVEKAEFETKFAERQARWGIKPPQPPPKPGLAASGKRGVKRAIDFANNENERAVKQAKLEEEAKVMVEQAKQELIANRRNRWAKPAE